MRLTSKVSWCTFQHNDITGSKSNSPKTSYCTVRRGSLQRQEVEPNSLPSVSGEKWRVLRMLLLAGVGLGRAGGCRHSTLYHAAPWEDKVDVAEIKSSSELELTPNPCFSDRLYSILYQTILSNFLSFK